ncbi:MAG: Transcriptional regulatory protein YycF [Planctomycetes bacterium ADurb.Bin401]|nr:MAG: Transcriptional regulatory protein YycF [Planctomycetes bacterium ADurb.Bin401]
MDTKELYTTGEAAELCSLSQQTIIRCFDSGRLRGFRIPGSKFRKIPRDSLMKFMKENNIPVLNMQQSGRKRLLIVDDDAEIVELMTDVLARDGRFEVRTASTGYDAGIMTQKFRPDLILLDYMLPDVNGNIVCKTIKQDPEFANTRIIIISGVINQSEIDDLLKAGAEAFIKKPFNITDLIDRIAVSLQA